MLRLIELRPDKQRGFALLVTIVLVAFLVLILVGLATFTRVETQVADNSQQLTKARQNAIGALNIALGQLQRQAGPDQAVTARSELSSGGGLPANQAFITGVWDTSAGAPAAAPTAWLVSGTEPPNAINNILGNILTPVGAGLASFNDDLTTAANNWVFLVFDNSVGGTTAAEQARRVRVLKQPLQAPTASLPGYSATAAGSATIGHYAYWVGDEGVKASASLVEPALAGLNYNNSGLGGDDWSLAAATATAATGTDMRERLSQFSLLRSRLEQVIPALDYTDATTLQQLARIMTLDQLLFVPNAPTKAVWQANFHQFTPLSRGVIAQTNGGTAAGTNRLRADLSASVAAPAVGTAPLNDYWVQRPSAVSGLIATYPIVTRKGPVAGSNLSFSVAPVLSEAGIFFKFGTNGTGQLILQYAVLGEFWNPYAATLQTSAGSSLRIRVNVANPFTFSNITDTASTVHAITVPAGDLALATIPAGQAFTRGSVIQLQTTPASALTNAGFGAADTTLSSGVAAVTPVTAFDAPAVAAGDIKLILESNSSGIWQLLQTYELTARVAAAGSSPGVAYACGYGFELTRDMSLWSNPINAKARDPRAPTFTPADHFESAATGHWKADAAATQNPAGLAGNAPFQNLASLVLFDLPRQEITNLAQLRHLPGNVPYEFGAASAGNLDNGLFDTGFVSTVPRNFAGWSYGTNPRPNRFVEVYAPPAAPVGEFDTAANQLASLRSANSARYQMIRGAFNVNSTSVEAWSAVLGANLYNWRSQSAPVTSTDTLTRAFFRAPHGAQELSLSGMVTSAALTDVTTLPAAGRQLTVAEINALATQIVAQLIARGRPFASLSEFANSTVLSGAIAAAGLNGALLASYQFTSGAITPGDILACIAPFMSARSDTFKIRAYGDVVNPVTKTVTGRAWCEAVVQRTPDLVANPGAAVAAVVKADPAVNPFGRKFNIISFRWLNSTDL